MCRQEQNREANVDAEALNLLLREGDKHRQVPGEPRLPIIRQAGAWARVSTDMQEARKLSISEQLRQIRSFAARTGYELAGEFWEAASAFRHEERRVEFHRRLDFGKNSPTVRVILVHDYSRFSRDSLSARTLIKELRQQDIQVLSLSDPLPDSETPMGVFMEAITFAKNEASRVYRENTRRRLLC